EVEHRVVEGVEAGQRDELEAVPQLAQVPLEGEQLVVRQVALPVERRRAVVGERLAWMLGMYRLREAARLLDVRLGRLAPDQVGVRRVGHAAGDCLVEPGLHAVEALWRAVAREELAVG